MPGVDDLAAGGVDTTPERERLVEAQGEAFALTVRKDDAPHAAPHSDASRQTRPSTADRTHSRSEPKTTSTPMLPGA